MPFAVLQEKPLASEVLLGCWCSTMDLVALTTADGQLCVHRLDWRKVWLTCPDVRITALCWKPDGKVLAAGHKDGSISLYDIERSELIGRHAAHSAPVAGLSWVEETPPPGFQPAAAASDAGGDPASASAGETAYTHRFNTRHTRFFAQPVALPGAGSGGGGGGGTKLGKASAASGLTAAFGEPSGETNWPPPVSHLNVLVATDVGGNVKMLTFGSVVVASLRLLQPSPPSAAPSPARGPPASPPPAGSSLRQVPRAHPIQCSLLRSLHHLAMLYSRAATLEATSAAGHHDHHPPALQLCFDAYSTAVLASQRRGLYQLSTMSEVISSQLAAAREALSAAAREWRGAMSEFGKKVRQQLRWTLEDHDCADPDPEGELLTLLAAGYVSPGLHAYLTGTLTESGLRRLARAVDGAANKVHEQLLSRVQPALELAAFALGDLKGSAAAAAAASGSGSAGAAASSATAGVSSSGSSSGSSGGLCLRLEDAARAEMEACKALLQATRLRLGVTTVATQYRGFFTWLLSITQQLDASGDSSSDPPASLSQGQVSVVPFGSDLEVIMAFLVGGQFKRDRIVSDLQDQEVPEADDSGGGGLAAVESLAPPAEGAPAADVCKALLEGFYAGGSGGGGGGASGGVDLAADAWPTRPLFGQLKHLEQLCTSAFNGCIQGGVEPTITPAAPSLLLTEPSFRHGTACAMHASQSRPEGDDDNVVHVCCTMPAPSADNQQQRESSSLGGNGSSSCGSLLLASVRFEGANCRGSRPGENAEALVASTSGQGAAAAAVRVHAVLVQLPPHESIQAVAFYRDQQLALLLSSTLDDSSRLAVVPTSGWQLADVTDLVLVPPSLPSSAAASSGGAISCEAACRRLGAVRSFPSGDTAGSGRNDGDDGDGTRVLSRPCPSGAFRGPMMVSGPRGVAAALTTTQRVLVIDLEDHDDEEEEEEEEEGAAAESDVDSETDGGGGGEQEMADENGSKEGDAMDS